MVCTVVRVRFKPDSLASLDIQILFAAIRLAEEEALELPTKAAGSIFVEGFNHEKYASDLEHRRTNEGGHA